MLNKNSVFERFCAVKVEIAKEKPKLDFGGVKGKLFVVTGTLECGTRTEVHNIIKKAGGKVSNSVTRSTNFLVVGPDAKGTTKYNKAISLGVKIITESELLDMIETK